MSQVGLCKGWPVACLLSQMCLFKAGLLAISYGPEKGRPAFCLKDVPARYIKSACIRVGLLAIPCFPDPV